VTFEDILQQTIAILQHRGRVSYRALKRQFALDDAYLDDLKAELLYAYPHVVDEDGRGLTWPAATAASSTAPAPSAPVASYESVREPRAYTPPHLAEKILTSRTALEGERKQVTVLFTDVSGFTSISEKLDPEDVHQLMNRAFELILGEVHRYEGTINQFLGDGVMALFGAPIAHEDHAQRAVHAALGMQRVLHGYGAELQRTQGITFRVRMGLNTGLVVVGSIGDNLRMDYTAVGDTTNLASRMVNLAGSGQVVIAEDTHRAVSGYFVTRPLGERAIKGKAEPVNAYEVVRARGLRTRLEVGAERGLTPFVGREHELALLQERWAEARAGPGRISHGRGGDRQIPPAVGVSTPARRRAGDVADGPVHLLRQGDGVSAHHRPREAQFSGGGGGRRHHYQRQD
jgi:class 3 adenylate cyclase